VASKGLAKLGKVGEALDRQIEISPASSRYADPPFEAGFCFTGSGVAASCKWSRARGRFRAQRAACYIALKAASPADTEMRTELPDTGNPHGMRGKPPYELEIL
jgi:hypothetical protein